MNSSEITFKFQVKHFLIAVSIVLGISFIVIFLNYLDSYKAKKLFILISENISQKGGSNLENLLLDSGDTNKIINYLEGLESSFRSVPGVSYGFCFLVYKSENGWQNIRTDHDYKKKGIASHAIKFEENEFDLLIKISTTNFFIDEQYKVFGKDEDNYELFVPRKDSKGTGYFIKIRYGRNN